MDSFFPHNLQANKMEISLSNSSSLSNQQQPVGVIVKYNDTSHKLNPIQLTHSNVDKVNKLNAMCFYLL